MPFKLKLKKTRQYNVASKNLFVISVELLDGGVADCTLSVDSTGQECLDNVCQRQAINQPEFFGLRYVSRGQQQRWVQLERPLKRQLDKYASSHQVYLRVMYYVVNGTGLITDEVTRYHYFLQLKNDLIEGRIICDCQQAVVLASYSRQAEYGNHDRERHTVEYLKNLLTFPKQMLDGGQVIESSSLAETAKLEWLTSAVIEHHITLHNMSQAQAEEGFISACQRLRGYGQELFAAEDARQRDVTIAVSLTGVMVLSEAGDSPQVYRWSDITNVINHKRTFTVELASGAAAAHGLPSPEAGKYVWRLCVLQHTFYTRHRDDAGAGGPVGGGGAGDRPVQEPALSAPRAAPEPEPRAGSLSAAASTSCLELRPRRALLPVYRQAPDYETAIQHKYQQQLLPPPAHPRPHFGSHPDIHRYPDVTRHALGALHYPPFALNPNVRAELGPGYANVCKPPPPYPCLASNSTPDLAAASQAGCPHVTGSSPDLVSGRARLPPSRPAHGTYSNLSSAADASLSRPDLRQLYDERGVLYAVPVLRAPCPRHAAPDAQEPIYENVPLPWQSEKRDRAHSLSATDGMARLGDRLACRPAGDSDGHYVNAQVLAGREPGAGRDAPDDTPYQSLSARPADHVTSVLVPDVKSLSITSDFNCNVSSGAESGLSAAYNSTFSTVDSEISVGKTSVTSVSSKEKKRRRWGVFMGRKDVKSATLGRDKSPAPVLRHRWSTGLPKFQPLPPSISKETLCQILERKMQDNQLAYAFEQIPKGRDTADDSPTARRPECAAFNGPAPGDLPYEDNRVRLPPGPGNPRGYYNASNITMTVGNKQRFYVLARLPAPRPPPAPDAAAADLAPWFWRCAWLAGARVLAGVRAAVHLPRAGETLQCGEFHIHTESVSACAWGATSRVRVSRAGRRRALWHAAYAPAGPPPHTDVFLAFLTELSALSASCAPDPLASRPPLLLYCSHGSGQSGTALAADLLLHILDSNQELDIPRTIGLLHQQRADLVQTAAQYRLLHEVLLLYLRQSRLI